MPTGSVKWFNAEKGFGFIVPDDPGSDIFVHISAVKNAGWEGLEEGQRLEFELREGRNGRVSADNLSLAGDAAGGSAAAPAGGAAAGPALVPLLFVDDVSETSSFYRHVLGFEELDTMEDGGTVNWAELGFGEARIWFATRDEGAPAESGLSGMLYFLVADVDTKSDEVTGRAEVLYGPEDKPYGLRELAVKDSNGYTIVFAQQLDD